MDEKRDNQGLLGGRDNPSYGCVVQVPAFNPTYSTDPLTTQPGFHDNQRQTPAAVYPPDHCALAWFACLCCFWPVGICAIINSISTSDAISRGDVAAANNYSQSARRFALKAITVGICVYVLVVILRFALASSSSSSSSSSDY